MTYDLGYALEREAEFQGDVNRITGSPCIEGEPVFYDDFIDEGTKPGQIYSKAGIDEFKISGVCEHHFDEWFGEYD